MPLFSRRGAPPPTLAVAIAAATALWCAAVRAQPEVPREFPPGAAAPSADELRERLAGKVLRTTIATTGVGVRADWRADGWVHVNTTNGARFSGQWRAEDGRLCTRFNTPAFVCQDARVSKDRVHVRRDDGEVLSYEPS